MFPYCPSWSKQVALLRRCLDEQEAAAEEAAPEAATEEAAAEEAAPEADEKAE